MYPPTGVLFSCVYLLICALCAGIISELDYIDPQLGLCPT